MVQPSVSYEFTWPFRMNTRRARLTEEQFMSLCQENPELRLELTSQGELIVMPPVGSEGGWRSGRAFYSLTAWADQDGTGVSFDSSTGFTLPNGGIRSPDASWIKRERWEALSRTQQATFAPVCPDFVIEVRLQSDRFSDLKEKMQEYLDNGARLGWLIDPLEKRAYVYRPGQAPEIFDDPAELSGDPVLPGFVLLVRGLWEFGQS